MRSRPQKIFIFIAIFLIVFNLPVFFKRTSSAAAIVCSNCANWTTQIASAAKDAAKYAWDLAKSVKDEIELALRDQVAFRIMNKVANDTATWIQGGGKPSYVRDWNSFVKEAGKLAFDSTIKEVGLARLCSPFSLQVKIGLLPEKRFSDQISCTLDDVVRNIKNFYINFENGGWIAYNESWQPQNNYFGEMILIQDQIQTEASKKITAATNEAVSGGGFLSQKQCVEWDSEQLDECLNSEWEAGVSDEQKMEICQQEVACAKEEIITPGDTIGKAAAEAITTDSKWAAGIQSWTSMLINSLINRAIKEGLGAIKGAGGGNRGSSYGGSSATITNLVDTQLIQEQQTMVNEIKKFISEWQYYLSAKNKALSYAQQELTILNQINSINCQPPVSNSQILILQTDISKLQTDIATLQNQINEGNKLISDLNAAESTARLMDLQQTYVSFSSKYNTFEFQQALIDGSGRSAVDAEANKFRNDLQDAQNRLNACTVIGG